MGELSPWHWAVVIGIAVLLFGAKRLPDAARSLGRSARILRAELHGQSPVADAAPAAGGATAAPAPVVAPIETQEAGQPTTVAQAPTPG